MSGSSHANGKANGIKKANKSVKKNSNSDSSPNSMMNTNARKIAVSVLIEFEKGEVFSDELLLSLLSQSNLDRRDRALAEEITYGTIEKLFSIDYILAEHLTKEISKLAPIVRAVLRTAVYQLIYLDKLPSHAVVNEAVKIVTKKAQYAKGLVNAVLRNVIRNSDKTSEYLSKAPKTVQYNMSNSILEMIESQYPDMSERIIAGLNQRANTYVYINTCRVNEAVQALELEATKTENSFLAKSNIVNTEEFSNGEFFVQGRASSFLVNALECKKGETVLDLCASPGGKSFAAAMCSSDRAQIMSFDVSENKIRKIEESATRMGLNSIETQISDATIHREDLCGMADKVICDVPCSAIGIMAKKVDIRHKDISMVDLPKTQLKILENAFSYLKPNGKLLYSTCTLNKAENEMVIKAFLESKPTCKVISLDSMIVEQKLDVIKSEFGYIFLPSSEQDGFFGVILVRNS